MLKRWRVQQQQHHGHHHGSSHHHSQSNAVNMNSDGNDNDQFEDAVGSIVATFHETSSTGGASSCMNASNSPHLPNPPSLANLEEIADTIAAVQVRRFVDYLASNFGVLICLLPWPA